MELFLLVEGDMMMNLYKKILSGCALVTLLASCGGGSSESTAVTTIAYSPSTLSASYFQNQSSVNSYSSAPPSADVSITLGGELPSGTVYVVIVQDQPLFANASFSQTGPYSFTATLFPELTLTPNTYSGNLVLHLCKDSGCGAEYALSGATLPYTVTVTPELKITVKIDGVVSSTIHPSSSNSPVTDIWMNTIYWKYSPPASVATLTAGQVLELESNIPVNWTGAGDLYPYGYMWAPSVKTSTTFRQVVPALPAGTTLMTGNSFIAMPATGGAQHGAGFNIDVSN